MKDTKDILIDFTNECAHVLHWLAEHEWNEKTQKEHDTVCNDPTCILREEIHYLTINDEKFYAIPKMVKPIPFIELDSVRYYPTTQ